MKISSLKSNIINKIIDIYRKIKKDNNLLYTLYSYFLLLSPILITLDRFIKISGTLLTGIPFVLGMLIIIKERKHLLKYLIITLLFFISVTINKDYIDGFELFKPIIIFLLSLDLCKNENFLKNLKQNFIKFNKEILIIITIIVGLNLLIVLHPAGYSDIDTETWGLKAYMGLYSSPHQAAYRFSTIIVFIAYLYTISNNNKPLISTIAIITTFLLLKTGARTPTIIGIFIIFFLLLKKRNKIIKISKQFLNKYKNKAIIVIPILIMISMYFVINSAFVQKIINLSTESFDSGRSLLREKELNYFINSDIKNILFGNSLNRIYTINHSALGARIWCHNDFMQILLQFGLTMLTMYIYSVLKFIKYNLKKIKTKETKILLYILIFIFIFVSFYNGLFFFPRFTIVIPLLYIMIKDNILEVKQ